MKNSFDCTDPKWKERHQQLQTMLAGYLDRELSEHESVQVEAHLIGCSDCRQSLERQRLISQKLAELPGWRTSAELHDKLDTVVYSSTQSLSQRLHDRLFRLLRGVMPLDWYRSCALGGWLTASVLAIVLAGQSTSLFRAADIAMVDDALAQYRRAQQSSLPELTEPQSGQPVSWSGGTVLSSWSTTVGGSPAQVFVVRSGEHVVYQYRIDESVLFRNPVVRKAIAEQGSFSKRYHDMDVRALPLESSGLILVGPSGSIPSSGSISVNSI